MKRISSRAIIIEDNKLLVIFRRKIKDGVKIEYYVIPGGGLEEGETLEENVIREIKEELNIDIEIIKKLETLEFDETIENYFQCKRINGTPKLSGEEKERMSDENYYEVRYIDLDKLDEYDIKAKDIIKRLL